MELLQSPFAVPREDVAALEASQAFGVLRAYLAGQAEYVVSAPSWISRIYAYTNHHRPSFCASHAHSAASEQQTWLLHRDMLHALIMPVVALFSRASAVAAAAALCTPKSEDLELAFAGEARGAFLCLQCFITEEHDWCRTRGCPACVVTATLSTDSHIRLTIAASLLSTAAVAAPASSPAAAAPADPTRALPPLPHMLPALRAAVSDDPFWAGPDIWSCILARATQLSAGIQALIAECVNLESLVASPARPGQKRVATHPTALFASTQPVEEKGVRLRKSKLAKRQLRLRDEEVEMMRRLALQCWAQARIPRQIRGQVLGLGGSNRPRSLTCP